MRIGQWCAHAIMKIAGFTLGTLCGGTLGTIYGTVPACSVGVASYLHGDSSEDVRTYALTALGLCMAVGLLAGAVAASADPEQITRKHCPCFFRPQQNEENRADETTRLNI